jgi:hypothetical protein
LVGLRSAAVGAHIHVVHGIVTNKGLGYSVALPVSQWITPGGGFWLKDRIGSTYWPTLDVAFREAAMLGDSIPSTIAIHPNHSLIHRRTILEVHFTPEEALQEQAALMDMHFDCITRWIACSTRGQLLPEAAAEENTDSLEWERTAADALPRSICPTIQFRAREEQDVLVATIISSQAAPRQANASFNPLDKRLTHAHIDEVLKGGAHVGAGDVLLVTVYCRDDETKCRRPLPGVQVILTGTAFVGTSNSKILDFDGGNCGVIEVTPENVAAAQEGVKQDFGPRY